MSARLETVRQMVERCPNRWGADDATRVVDFGGGLSAAVLRPRPVEAISPPGEAHIVSYIMRGEGYCRMWHDQRLVVDRPICADSVHIVPAGVAPRGTFSVPVEMLHVFVPAQVLSEHAGRASGTTLPRSVDIVDPMFTPDPPLHAVLRSIAESLVAPKWQDRLWLDSLGNALVARLLQRWSTLSDAERVAPVRGGLAGWQVRRVTEYIQDRLTEDVTLNDLAALVGLSPRHLCTAFHQSTGLPPHRWQIERRIEQAKAMLADPARSVTDVALACGFGSSAHFATTFRRAVGRTPRDWRRDC